MSATEAFLRLVKPEAMDVYGDWLAGLEGASVPDWTVLQGRLLNALDAYAAAEMELPPDFEIASHEAGGQCRVLFPHVRARSSAALRARLSAILEARLAWAEEHLFHGYVDCHEVHHEPETFLYFQVPYMHLSGDSKAVAAVEDLAHHVGNWEPGVPDWYDWGAHGFKSTWLGTRGVRAYPPYDYQEANHFRFVAIGLASYAATGKARYLELAEDYAQGWCAHIQALAGKGEPIVCSILPAGARRQEMGYGGRIKGEVQEGVYPTFYATVATNTAYDIVTVLMDLYRITGQDEYREASRAMIAQFFENGDAEGRPAFGLTGGEWVVARAPDDPTDGLSTALRGANDLLVRMADKYRAVTGETCFDGALLRWAALVDESSRMADQVHISLLVAAHRITGEPHALARAYAMALRGMAVTEADKRWHQCDSRGRYGFKYVVEPVYHPMLAGVDYATRGGLPLIGLAHETAERPGLPQDVAVRVWEPSPETWVMEAVNGGEMEAEWRVSGEGTGGRPVDLALRAGAGTLAAEDGGWRIRLPAGGRVRVSGRWTDRGRFVR